MSNKPVYSEKGGDPRRTSEAGIPRDVGSDEEYKVMTREAQMEEYNKLSFWTRMGCTPESFKRRTEADKHNQLNQTLKSRHMHMIAIGMRLSCWRRSLY
jgi:yeast amino acid transporter